MASLRLDAADRQQCVTADVDQVAPESECEQCRFRETQLAGSDENDMILESGLGKLAIYPRHGLLERQRNVVGKYKRSSACSSFSAVDRDEVDAAARFGHRFS